MNNYGIVELAKKAGCYRARVPQLRKGTYTSKDFSIDKYLDPISSARSWRDQVGEQTWGSEIWEYILKTKSVRCLWGKKGGVSICHKTIDGQGETWIVMWRENGKPKIKPFLLQNCSKAEEMANCFAKKKRVELTFLSRI